jgi:hypothetical protein
VLSKSAKQTSKARVLCKGLVLGAGAVAVRVYLTTKLCYLTTKGLVFGAVGGRVRCGFILHPSFSLVLGLVLRERLKSKE